MPFSEFFQFGAAGVAMFLFYLLASRTISANTIATNELVGAVKELKAYIQAKNE